MEPQIIKTAGFSIWAKGIRTTNAGGQSIRDQGAFWAQCMTEGFLQAVPMKDRKVFGLYHQYESDHTGAFNFDIGAEAADLNFEGSPLGLTCHTIPGGNYAVFTSRQGPAHEVVGEIWQSIWAWAASAQQQRAYTYDYEVYDLVQMATGQISVQVYIAIK